MKQSNNTAKHFSRFLPALFVAAIVALGFSVVYATTDYITRLHNFRFHVHWTFEPQIPIFPPAIVFYNSLSVMFLAAIVCLEHKALKSLAATMFLEIVIAGVFFIVFPVETAFPPHQDLGIWQTIFHYTEMVNLQYNFVPSLHVTFALTCAFFLGKKLSSRYKIFLYFWAMLICISTVLTHQHHIIDVFAGTALMGACCFSPRFAKVIAMIQKIIP